MADRVFLTLAILSLVATSVLSYGYSGYSTRDSGLRQVRRCPTCLANCPESLSSPWYESPMVYGQPISFKSNNLDYDQHFSTSAFPGHRVYLRETPKSHYNPPSSIDTNSYENPLSGELNSHDDSYANSRCPYFNCNSRSARSENISPTLEVEDSSIPTFGSTEPRDVTYDLLRLLSIYFPERHRELENAFGISPDAQARRVSRHYGNAYKNPQIGNGYEKSIYEDRQKSIETPTEEKVYVVYRADADLSMENEELDAVPVMTSTKQEQRSLQTSHRENSKPLSDSQLEEVVRRITAATRQNKREDALYGRSLDALRGMYYNEHEREGDEIFYNPRRPYNDALYRRFNLEEAIDREENARKMYRTGFRPSELPYIPVMSFNPYVMPLDTNIPSVSREEKIIPENNAHDNPLVNIEYLEPEVTGRKEDLRSKEEEDVETKKNDFRSEQEERKEAMSTIEELKEIDGEEEPKDRENYEESEVTLPLANYRTHSRLDEGICSESEEEVAKIEESTTLPTMVENDNVERMLSEVNPDLVVEIENPLTVTESALRLNFEPLEVSSSSPMN